MANTEFFQAFKELMDTYDEYKEKFIKMFGHEKGYDEWFRSKTFDIWFKK